MKRNILVTLIGLLCVGVSSFAGAANILKFNDNLSIRPGMTADIDIILQNDASAEGLFCEIEFPNGITADCATLNTERANAHTLDTKALGSNKYRVMVLSETLGNPIAGNDGTVVTLRVKASKSYTGGNITITNNSYLATSDFTDIYFNKYSALLAVNNDPVEYKLYAEPVTIAAGETAEMQIMLDNNDAVNGWYATFILPDGIKAKKATIGRKDGHTLTFNYKAEEHKVIIFADSKGTDIKSIPGTSGAVATVVLEADASVEEGTQQIQMKGAYVTNFVGNSTIADSNTDVEVTAAGVYELYIATPIAITGGETTEMKIMLNNTAAVNGWHATFILPEGITVDGAVIERTNGHVLTYNFIEDEHKLIIFADSEPDVNSIPENSGAVATVTLSAATDITSGTMTIYMKDAYITTASGNKTIGEVSYQISTTTAIQNVENATANNGAIYNLNGQRVSKAANGIFIQNGKKAVVK